MAYTRGTASAVQAARTAADRERKEVEALYMEGRRLAQTAKTLRQKNANIEAAITEQTAILEDKRAKLTQALADLGAAQHEADEAIRQAEANAALIRELAYDQARALAERAYRSGIKKGDDAARAKHAILSKLTPAPKPKPGKVIDLEPQPVLMPVRDGREGLEDATAEFFGYRRAQGIKAPGRQYKAAA
jgi:hypothetical protein